MNDICNIITRCNKGKNGKSLSDVDERGIKNCVVWERKHHVGRSGKATQMLGKT